MTGGRLWVDDATVLAVARPPDVPLTLPDTPEEKQQRALQEQIERQARQPASPRQLDALSDAQLLRLLQTGNSDLRRCGTVCRTRWCVRCWRRCASRMRLSSRWRGRMRRPAADCRPRHRVSCPMGRRDRRVSKKNAGRRLTYGDGHHGRKNGDDVVGRTYRVAGDFSRCAG
ncbi:hypothetical protein SODG_005923 [Sodalis praecaptivus]